MKQKYRILAALFCCLLLAGCGKTENPYRVDTVVRIPVDPTDAPTEGNTEPTEMETVPETTAETEPAGTEAASSESSPTKKPSSSRDSSSSSKPDSKSEDAAAAQSTEPPETEAPETEPPETEAATAPPATEAPTEEPTLPQTEPPMEAPETVPATEAAYDPAVYSVGSLEKAILKELNAYRAEAGLPELSLSSRLSGIAALRAREAAEIWSHTRPDGRNYTSAMSDYGYGCSVSAENLAYAAGAADAAAIAAKWMNTDSKDHILNESFTTAGIGIYSAGGVTYIANLLVG